MKKNYNLNLFWVTIFIFYLILIITNNFISFDQATLVGFGDQMDYLMIFEAAPGFSGTEINPNQAQRFFFLYIIGTFFEFIGLKKYVYIELIFLNILIHLLIFHIFLKILYVHH